MNYIVDSGETNLRPVPSTPLQEARFIVAQVCDLDPTSINSSIVLAEKLQKLAGAITTIVEEQGDIELFPLESTQTPAPPERTTALVRQFNDVSDPHAWQVRMFLAHQRHDRSAVMSMYAVKESSQWPLYNIVVPTAEQLDELLFEEDPSTWRDTHTVAQDFRSGTLEQAYPFHRDLGGDDAPRRYFGILRQLSTDLLAAAEQ